MHRKMFNFALSAVFSAGLAMAAPQDAAPPPDAMPMNHGSRPMMMDPDQQLQTMTKRLNLSGDQATQIRPLLVDRMAQVKALQADSSLAPRDRFAKMRSISQETNSKISAILTDDQRAKFEAMEQHRRDAMRERMQERQNGGADTAAPNQ